MPMPSVPKAVLLILSAMLFLAAAPLPYGYYGLLRIIATMVFAWSGVVAFKRGYGTLPWLFAVLAILFNPLMPIYLDKGVWGVIDIVSAVFLLSVAPSISARAAAKEFDGNDHE